jgi:lysophospholipase L1-like esterase
VGRGSRDELGRRARLAASAVVVAAALLVSVAAAPAARSDTPPVRFVALGDSVAAGQGLDWSDWTRDDPCWRAGSDSPPGRFFATWKQGGAGRTFTLLACSGATTDDLLATGGQVDAAIAAAPTLVSLTIGANDLSFVNPAKFFVDGRLDQAVVDQRLADLRVRLSVVLARLVVGTDAKILVTTYHDPTADDPVGVPGCRGACFAAAAHGVVAQLNGVIAGVTTSFGAGRVRLVDVAPRFVGHAAPNGWGPDEIREHGLPSWLPSWVKPPADLTWALRKAASIQAYCSADHHLGLDPNWVSGIDCVHPNDDGAKAYAAAMVEVWRAAGWT